MENSFLERTLCSLNWLVEFNEGELIGGILLLRRERERALGWGM
jgi:hypothetical protein